MICVKCGAKGAVYGSMQHPYCNQCWTTEWNGDLEKFKSFLDNEHIHSESRHVKSYQNKKVEIDLFNELSGSYDSHLDADFTDYLLERLKDSKFNVSGQKILEPGCATGWLGSSLVSIFPNSDIIGVDISNKMIEKANNLGIKGYSAIVGDIEDPNLFKEGEFALIIVSCLLHHFKDPILVIQNLSKWLKVGGYIVVIEPNGSNPVNWVSKKFRNIFLPDNFIIKNSIATPNETDHSVREYVNKFKSAGLTIDTASSFWRPIAFNKQKKWWVTGLILIRTAMFNIMHSLFPNRIFSGTQIYMAVKK